MTPIFNTLRVLAVTVAMAPAFAPTFALAQISQPQPPEIAARNYLLVDVTANQVLGAKDIDAPIEQASLTKLMTGYLVFDALRAKKISLEQRFPVSERAWKMPGSRMFIDPKMQVPVDDLIKGMIVQSGNDATVALAEGVGGSLENFVRLMNEQAKALGMKGTSYKNPEGLTEPGHLTTARDLSILAQRLMQEFPEYMHYYATKQYHYAGTPASNGTNRNTLLFRDPTVDGLKTGHTAAAGYCLVSTSKRTMPQVGERRLLSIVLGASSANARATESQKLLNWGYTAFDSVKLFDVGQPVATPEVWKGQSSTIQIGQPKSIVVTVPAGSAGKLKTEVVRQDPLIAPFTKGQAMGTLKVTLDGQVVAEVPLVALEAVEQAGFFGRLWDSIRLWIK
ncbi:D-alanyl-D-alanine carboxypeptidase family protein [Pantoea sp. 18069]|uniref:D-alanyl-D-alanine carboxypeptidase family protein n=1 Tax=Pantoea sp. 18069 TaxID=2681415 RepID=UPI001359B526|nr:D-alanyl-D-alanine carboxypeptidase family protein [Pantoea sp. 18069]